MRFCFNYKQWRKLHHVQLEMSTKMFGLKISNENILIVLLCSREGSFNELRNNEASSTVGKIQKKKVAEQKNQQKIRTKDKTKDGTNWETKGNLASTFSCVLISFAWINGFLLSAKKSVECWVELPFFSVLSNKWKFQCFSFLFAPFHFQLSSGKISASLISRLMSEVLASPHLTIFRESLF